MSGPGWPWGGARLGAGSGNAVVVAKAVGGQCATSSRGGAAVGPAAAREARRALALELVEAAAEEGDGRAALLAPSSRSIRVGQRRRPRVQSGKAAGRVHVEVRPIFDPHATMAGHGEMHGADLWSWRSARSNPRDEEYQMHLDQMRQEQEVLSSELERMSKDVLDVYSLGDVPLLLKLRRDRLFCSLFVGSIDLTVTGGTLDSDGTPGTDDDDYTYVWSGRLGLLIELYTIGGITNNLNLGLV